MDESAAAPVLSTPDTNIFDQYHAPEATIDTPRLSDEQIHMTYEIQRTIDEIRAGRWKRIALQFPDQMLLDAPRVFQALAHGIKYARSQTSEAAGVQNETVDDLTLTLKETGLNGQVRTVQDVEERLFILADTSYGACCVDEVAAEHADADVVVHYGRSCLSPTVRLPVIYCFTKPSLSIDAVREAFKTIYPNKDDEIILMADIPYCDYLPQLNNLLEEDGYSNLFVTSVIHNTASPLPNRTIPEKVAIDTSTLRNYKLFHLSEPPASLLLTLSSRVGSIQIYPTTNTSTITPYEASSRLALRRRYALLTSLNTVPIFGILINTLSVRNYMAILTHVKSLIAAAGKKSYTFVVGKVNAAKIANFSEVGGWVVIGCWESSLFDSSEFWKPVITPFELELVLLGDENRVWTGKWSSDFQALLDGSEGTREAVARNAAARKDDGEDGVDDEGEEFQDSEEDSAPPEFDLRTGRYVSNTRPMASRAGRRAAASHLESQDPAADGAGAKSLIKRANGDLAMIGAQVSPAAEFFKNKRTWQGLGSDFAIAYDADGAVERQGAVVEEGRSGIARGYAVGGDATRS